MSQYVIEVILFCLLFNQQTSRKIFVQNPESGTSSNGCECAVSITMPPEENETNGSQETITSMGQ